MEENIFDEALSYVKHLLAEEYSGHDWYHAVRVCNTAEKLAIAEGANLETVRLAALLHDVDDRKLFPETYEGKLHAASFLRQHNYPAKKIAEILTIIQEVSFAGTDSVVPHTVEGKCVQDADRLDAIGAIGVGRAFAYGGSHDRLMYDPETSPQENMDRTSYYASKSTTINHFYEKLLLLKDMMTTPSGRKIAEGRDAFLRSFLSEFLAEWEGTL